MPKRSHKYFHRKSKGGMRSRQSKHSNKLRSNNHGLKFERGHKERRTSCRRARSRDTHGRVHTLTFPEKNIPIRRQRTNTSRSNQLMRSFIRTSRCKKSQYETPFRSGNVGSSSTNDDDEDEALNTNTNTSEAATSKEIITESPFAKICRQDILEEIMKHLSWDDTCHFRINKDIRNVALQFTSTPLDIFYKSKLCSLRDVAVANQIKEAAAENRCSRVIVRLRSIYPKCVVNCSSFPYDLYNSSENSFDETLLSERPMDNQHPLRIAYRGEVLLRRESFTSVLLKAVLSKPVKVMKIHWRYMSNERFYKYAMADHHQDISYGEIPPYKPQERFLGLKDVLIDFIKDYTFVNFFIDIWVYNNNDYHSFQLTPFQEELLKYIYSRKQEHWHVTLNIEIRNPFLDEQRVRPAIGKDFRNYNIYYRKDGYGQHRLGGTIWFETFRNNVPENSE